jgi:hypothetical protein
MRGHARWFGAPVIAVAMASAGAARAQEDHAASRTIGETTFMLPAMADSAFVLTEVGFRQDVSYESIPSFPVEPVGLYDLSWVQFEERLDLAVRLTPWLGLYAQGTGSGALGPDTASLVFEGGGLDFGGKLGAAVRVFRSDRTGSQVTLRAYGGGDAGRTLDLLGFAEVVGLQAAREGTAIVASTPLMQLPYALENEGLSLANSNYEDVIFYGSSTARTGASLHYAQVLVGPLTLQVSAALERAWSREAPYSATRQEFITLSTVNTTATLDGVLSASFNRQSVPLGVSAEYASVTATSSLKGAGTYGATTQYVGGGVWFTGRRGLEIGVLGFRQRSLRAVTGYETTETSAKPVGYLGSLVFRALW